jgi:hypothetical protein
MPSGADSFWRHKKKHRLLAKCIFSGSFFDVSDPDPDWIRIKMGQIQWCGYGFFPIPDPGSASKNLSILPQKIVLSMIRIHSFYTSRIPDPGVKKTLDHGSGSAKVVRVSGLGIRIRTKAAQSSLLGWRHLLEPECPLVWFKKSLKKYQLSTVYGFLRKKISFVM